jgi:hypothetical protein
MRSARHSSTAPIRVWSGNPERVRLSRGGNLAQIEAWFATKVGLVIASHRVLSLLLALLLITTGAVQAQATHVGSDSLYTDPTLTPGAAFDGVTADQVCMPGYSRRVRNVTSAERAQVYAEYSTMDIRGADEVDHFTPLELGGSNDITNLWPEPYGARSRESRVENYLHEQVCSDALPLAEARQMITSDWYAVYLTLADGPAATGASGPPSSTPIADSPSTSPAPGASDQAVSFASVNGAPPGGRASVPVQTDP